MVGIEDNRNISLNKKGRYLKDNFKNKIWKMEHKFRFPNMSVIQTHSLYLIFCFEDIMKLYLRITFLDLKRDLLLAD